jgi:hypothetical protein
MVLDRLADGRTSQVLRQGANVTIRSVEQVKRDSGAPKLLQSGRDGRIVARPVGGKRGNIVSLEKLAGRVGVKPRALSPADAP